MDAEQLKMMASLVGTRQAELLRGGMTRSKARAQAVSEIGAMRTPPLSGSELETALAYRLASLYTDWCTSNNWICSDVMLAHFTGRTHSAYNYCRRILTQAGFSFTPSNGGWNIEKPKSPPPQKQESFTRAEVEAIIRKVLGGN